MRIYSVGVDRVRDVLDLPPEHDRGPALEAAPRAVVFDDVGALGEPLSEFHHHGNHRPLVDLAEC